MDMRFEQAPKLTFTSDQVVSFAHEVGIEPPLNTPEAIAIAGFMNQTPPETPEIEEIRFGIITSKDHAHNGRKVDSRYLALCNLLYQMRRTSK